MNCETYRSLNHLRLPLSVQPHGKSGEEVVEEQAGGETEIPIWKIEETDGKIGHYSVDQNFILGLNDNDESFKWDGLYRFYVATYNIIPSKLFMEKLNYFLTNELPAQIELAQQILRETPDPSQKFEDKRRLTGSIFSGSGSCQVLFNKSLSSV